MLQAAAFHQSRHLTADEVYDATEKCPVCLGVGDRKPVVRLQESPAIDLLECPRCRACSASLMPRPEVLNNYYTDYYKAGQDRNTCPNAARFADRIAGHTEFSFTGRPIRILDFGGGDGRLARKIADRLLAEINGSVEIDLVDYEKPGDYGTHWLRICGYRTLQEVRGPYDLVIASAVLEHIPEMHPVLCRLFALLRPAGYFYARTPYVVPFARLIRSLDFTYPGHVHDLGSAFWNRVSKTFGLNARFIISAPSLVETTFASHPVRTVLAAILKAPGRFEELLSKRSRPDRWWNFVGGWEIMLQSCEPK